MSTNSEAAEAFREIADLLDVLGERFKPEAYRRAVRSIESLTEDLRTIAGRNELRSIPGVGDAIEEKIRELLATGKIEYRERLRKEVPRGILELLKIPGLGPKTARRFWTELGVEGPQELSAAIAAGRLDGVKGFGPKKIAQIRTALDTAQASPGTVRMPIESAYPIAHRLLDGLRVSGAIEQLEAAGSFRRCRESVGDLDILATSGAPERVFDTFSALPDVKEIRLRGGTKETVILTNGLQVDLRVVEPAAFGAAWLYFTGSKDHNVHLRSLARDRGLKINEYGIFRGDERVGGRTEEEMYRALELAWIPPEIREDRGEIDRAAKGAVPRLVEATDLRGDLHVHLPEGATGADVDRTLEQARRAGYAYLAIVVGGIGADGDAIAVPEKVRDRLTRDEIRGLTVARALEVPAGHAAGKEAPAHEITILRPVRDAPDPPAVLPGNGRRPLLAHVGGGDVGRRWIAWAAASRGTIEVGPGPERLDSIAARGALEAGLALAIPTGLGRTEEDPTPAIGLGFARRAGAEKGSIANAAGDLNRIASSARSGRTPSGS